MRILHIFKTYYPDTYGGIEQVIYHLAEGLSAYQEIDVQVLTVSSTAFPCRILLDHHEIYRARRLFKVASTDISFSFFSLFRKLAISADIIHYHFPWPLMDVAHFFTRTKKPTVLSYHSDIIAQKRLLPLYRPLQNHFLSKVDRIIVTCPNYLKSSQVLPNFQDKVRFIPYGLDKNNYGMPDSARLRYWSRVIGKKFFLFVGVFRYYKGLEFLIKAAKEAPYPIVLVGKGGEENKLKKLAEKEKVKNIYFLGALSNEDKNALLYLCHAFVFPSCQRTEAFGISLLEAAIYGKALISCEVGTGTSYVNINRETGLIVPPGNIKALSAAMRELWMNEKLAWRLGKNAQKRFELEFTAQKMTEAYLKIYKDILR